MKDWHSIRWRSAVMLTSVAIFIASLTQTGFVIDDPQFGNEEVPGVGVLVVGWAATIFEGVSPTFATGRQNRRFQSKKLSQINGPRPENECSEDLGPFRPSRFP